MAFECTLYFPCRCEMFLGKLAAHKEKKKKDWMASSKTSSHAVAVAVVVIIEHMWVEKRDLFVKPPFSDPLLRRLSPFKRQSCLAGGVDPLYSGSAAVKSSACCSCSSSGHWKWPGQDFELGWGEYSPSNALPLSGCRYLEAHLSAEEPHSSSKCQLTETFHIQLILYLVSYD